MIQNPGAVSAILRTLQLKREGKTTIASQGGKSPVLPEQENLERMADEYIKGAGPGSSPEDCIQTIIDAAQDSPGERKRGRVTETVWALLADTLNVNIQDNTTSSEKSVHITNTISLREEEQKLGAAKSWEQIKPPWRVAELASAEGINDTIQRQKNWLEQEETAWTVILIRKEKSTERKIREAGYTHIMTDGKHNIKIYIKANKKGSKTLFIQKELEMAKKVMTLEEWAKQKRNKVNLQQLVRIISATEFAKDTDWRSIWRKHVLNAMEWMDT